MSELDRYYDAGRRDMRAEIIAAIEARRKAASGFSSFGCPHPSLADVLEKWAVRIVGAGVDKHGVYVEIAPL